MCFLFRSYVMSMWVAFDTEAGHVNVAIYNRAREQRNLPDFEKLNKDHQLVYFLDQEIELILQETHNECQLCRAALALKKADMYHLTSKDFICSDWLVEDSSSSTNWRDCYADDAAWLANPSYFISPCCWNRSLVLASLTLHVFHLEFGGLPADTQLVTLFDPHSDIVVNATAKFVEHHVDTDGFLLQLILARGDHLSGILYHAARPDKEYQPRLVETSKTFWSFNYAQNDALKPLHWTARLFWLLSIVHRGIELLYVQLPQSTGPRATPYQRLYGLATLLHRPYFVIVEIPSIVMPVVSDLLSRWLEVSVFVVLVAVNMMFLVVRLVQEAQVFSSVRIVVQAMNYSVGPTGSFMLIAMPVLLLLAAITVLLFGVFDENYRDYIHAISNQFRVLQSGSTKDDLMTKHSPIGSELMFYAAAVSLFLVLSQLLIAILVGAFEATRERNRELESKARVFREELSKMRPMRENSDALRTRASLALGHLAFWIGWWSPYGGDWAPRKLRGLRALTTESYPGANNSVVATFVPKEHAMRVLGKRATEALLAWYGTIEKGNGSFSFDALSSSQRADDHCAGSFASGATLRMASSSASLSRGIFRLRSQRMDAARAAKNVRNSARTRTLVSPE